MNSRSVLQIPIAGLCLWLVATGVALADEIQNPLPKAAVEWHPSRKIFFAGTTALAISSSFDWTTTVGCVQRGCLEANSRWAIGSHPNNLNIVRFAATSLAVQTTGFYFTERSHYRWVRWAGRAYVAYSVGGHIFFGLRNRRTCRPTSLCGP
jgi:hypothetical protein